MSNKMKQIIIVRKDLNLSHGKMAAQVSHASMAFLSHAIQSGIVTKTENTTSQVTFSIENDILNDWLGNIFTKVILRAKNKNDLMRAVRIATDNGIVENKDFFIIRDNCLTELEPEEEDGTCITCIGFKPMHTSDCEVVSKKFQLYT